MSFIYAPNTENSVKHCSGPWVFFLLAHLKKFFYVLNVLRAIANKHF